MASRRASAVLVAIACAVVGWSARAAEAMGPRGPIQEDGCIGQAAGQWLCGWTYPGNGLSGGAPVFDVHSVRVGFLHRGENWVVCQQPGRSVKVPVLKGQTDFHESTAMWAWTEADDARWGWASEAYGDWGLGSPNYVFPGWQQVPACNGAHGPAPGSPGAPRPKPRSKPKRLVLSPDACVHTTKEQWVTVRYRFLEIHQVDHTNNGTPGTPPLITNQKPPTYHDFARIKIGAQMCLGPHGWHPLEVINVNPFSVGLRDNDPGLPIGKGSTKGWGITINSYDNGTLTVGATACTKKTGHLWAGAKLLASIPIPKVNYAISALQWAAGLLPFHDQTKIKCGDLGSDQLTIGADRRGHLRVSEQVSTPSHRVPNMYGITEWTPYVLQNGRPTYYQLYERAIQPPVITPGG